MSSCRAVWGPFSIVAQEGVGEDDEFSHDDGDGNFGKFSCPAEALISAHWPMVVLTCAPGDGEGSCGSGGDGEAASETVGDVCEMDPDAGLGEPSLSRAPEPIAALPRAEDLTAAGAYALDRFATGSKAGKCFGLVAPIPVGLVMQALALLPIRIADPMLESNVNNPIFML